MRQSILSLSVFGLSALVCGTALAQAGQCRSSVRGYLEFESGSRGMDCEASISFLQGSGRYTKAEMQSKAAEILRWNGGSCFSPGLIVAQCSRGGQMVRVPDNAVCFGGSFSGQPINKGSLYKDMVRCHEAAGWPTAKGGSGKAVASAPRPTATQGQSRSSGPTYCLRVDVGVQGQDQCRLAQVRSGLHGFYRSDAYCCLGFSTVEESLKQYPARPIPSKKQSPTPPSPSCAHPPCAAR